MMINPENFNEEVLMSVEPVLVDFYANWCGPCKTMSPIVDELAETYKVCKVNVDEFTDLGSQYKVSSIPTFLIFKNGLVVNKIVGVISKKKLEKLLS